MKCTGSTVKSVALALVAAVAVLGATPSEGRAQGAGAVRKAQKLIDGEKNVIAGFCHPTATLDSLDPLGSQPTTDRGFRLDYALNYTSAFGNPFHTDLTFYFDADGAFTGQISVLRTNNRN